MLTVVCIKYGKKYGHEWVEKLRNMCDRNLGAHNFVCFTEDPIPGVYCRALPSALPGWWSKIGLFKPGLLAGDVLYLDLDVVIRRRLDGLVALLEQDRTRLWIRDDFSYSLRNPKRSMTPETRRLLGGDGCCNSSVMLWHGDNCRRIWDEFDPKCMDVLHGDQNAITQIMYPDHLRFIPDEWAGSYKYNGGEGAVAVFHGDPKPDRVPDPWVRECWR